MIKGNVNPTTFEDGDPERRSVASSRFEIMASTCLLDIDGVLIVSWRPLPGAADTLRWMKAKGIAFGLVTNTSSRSRREIAATLNDVGIEVSLPADIHPVSSAARYLVTRYPDANCLVVNEGSLDEDLIGVELTTSGFPDVVLLGGSGTSVGYRELDRVFKLAVDGVPVVALHRNTRFQTADGPALDMGAFIVGLEKAAGIEIPVVGKPSPIFFWRLCSIWAPRPQRRSSWEMTSTPMCAVANRWE